MRQFKHIVKGKSSGSFEETNLEEAINDVLRWHGIEVEEIFEGDKDWVNSGEPDDLDNPNVESYYETTQEDYDTERDENAKELNNSGFID